MQANLLTLQIQFTIAVLLALILRQCMRRLPKIYSYALWILVFGRLLCPFSFETEHAVMPDAGRVNQFVEQVSGETMTRLSPVQQDMSQKNDFFAGTMPQEPEKITITGIKRVARAILPFLWCLGTVLVLGINILALLGIYRKIRGAEQVERNVFVSGKIKTPFTFGFFRPQIFLPADMTETEQKYILCHEQVHISRKDYIVKGVAFLLTALYWFNPCVWVAFHFMEQDMEMSCDETVIRRLGNGVRRQYSQSLLDFAAGKKRRGYVPLAFGEVSVKQRIKNVLSQKSTKKYIGIVGMLALCAVAVVIFTVGSGGIVSAGSAENSAQDNENRDGVRVIFTQDEEPANAQNSAKDMPENVKDSENPVSKEGEDSLVHVSDRAVTDAKASVGGASASVGGISIAYGADAKAEQTAEQTFVTEWAEAFCGRDGNFIAEHSSASVQKGFMDSELLSAENGAYSFGMSSPWPWGEKDYRIRNLDEHQATVLYYAWTSEPHVTVWMERITFDKMGETYQVTEEELSYMDHISSHYEFCMAYPAGTIKGTPMDYSVDSTILNALTTSVSASSKYAKVLEMPETAVVFLLNLSEEEDEVQVKVNEKEGKTVASIYFAEEKKTFDIVMEQMTEADALIWVPTGQPFEEAEN